MVVLLGPAIIRLSEFFNKGGKPGTCRPDGGEGSGGAKSSPFFLRYIFNSSRVLATAAADFCSMASSSLLSFKVRIFFNPPGAQDYRDAEVKILQAKLSIQIG